MMAWASPTPSDCGLLRRATFTALPVLWAALGWCQASLPKPVSVVELPPELHEVSALTALDDGSVACLHDEAATLYFVDLSDGRITARHPFGPPGDLEGLTRMGDAFFALRSDGLIYRIARHQGRYATVDSFHLMLPYRNIEGLGYDPIDGRVLVAPKDPQKGGPSVRDKREVFAFDPATYALQMTPVLTFSVNQVLRSAQAQGVKIPMRTTGKGKPVPLVKLHMSAIAVQPATGHYFILSATDQALLVLDRSGGYVALHLLDPKLLPQPEGITFLPNGDMLIATEGKDAAPRIVRYRLASREEP